VDVVEVDAGERGTDGNGDPRGHLEDLSAGGRDRDARVRRLPPVLLDEIHAARVDEAMGSGAGAAVLVDAAQQGERGLAVERVDLDVDRRPAAAVVEELLGAEGWPRLALRREVRKVGRELFARDGAVARGDLPTALDPPQREDAARRRPEGTLDDDGVREVVPRDVGRVVPSAVRGRYVDAVRPDEVVDVELATGDHAPTRSADLHLELPEPPLLVEPHLERGLLGHRLTRLLERGHATPELGDALVAACEGRQASEGRSQGRPFHRGGTPSGT
jgi:hypothetical protein